jgi:hypothetical protein
VGDRDLDPDPDLDDRPSFANPDLHHRRVRDAGVRKTPFITILFAWIAIPSAFITILFAWIAIPSPCITIFFARIAILFPRIAISFAGIVVFASRLTDPRRSSVRSLLCFATRRHVTS